MAEVLDFYSRMWAPSDLADLPGDLDWRRVEIVDGLLVVSPQPGRAHARVVSRLLRLFDAALPSGLSTTNTLPIVAGRTYRVPDVAVIRDAAYNEDGDALAAADVVIAVEIESPSSTTTDRITKPAEYARAGIRYYWRVELDPLQLHIYRLSSEVYELVGSWAAAETASVTDPFDIEIELDALRPT